MSFSQLLSILIARKWIAIWVLLTTILVTSIVSFVLPKTYKATTTLIINFKGADAVTGLMLPVPLIPGYIATQVDILLSRNVALKVVDKLGIVNNVMAKAQFEKATKGAGDIRHWFAEQFTQNLNVNPSQESSVIEVSYEGADPKFVAAMANTFAEAYIETNLQLKTEPAKQAALWFDSQIKALRQNVEQAQSKLSNYQQENGIAFADTRLDTDDTRLTELSSQLVAAQAQTYESNSRLNQLKRGNAGESPDILSNSLIQGLKSQLAAAETKLADISQRLGVNHPQYLAATTEVANLKNLIRSEVSNTSSSIGQLARVSQQRENEIKSSLAEQKAQVLKLKDQHDQMAVLMREVESSQRIFDSALLRFGQTNMESQSGQTDVSVLNPAVPPNKHSSPNITLNIILSMFLGSLLALGFAFVSEMLDRRIRTPEDLEQLLELPVLHVVSASHRQPAGFANKLRQLFSKKSSSQYKTSDRTSGKSKPSSYRFL